MNKKNERIRKLWERGIRDKVVLARKLGYTGNAIQSGIERVTLALRTMKLEE